MDVTLKKGDRLSRYRIDALLGAGGMGAVYRAYDPKLERSLAVKVVGSADQSEESHARLLEEARSASALSHPNVCAIYEVGEDGPCTFIAMEYVEGRSLHDCLAEGLLPIEEATNYALQVADALTHAHERGVVHGDLKSANIMLTPAGRVKVVDFGLARRTHFAEATASTTSHAFVGTAYAMAPEQWRGERADARTDVWAFGILLYEMLSGTRPFQEESMPDLMSAILRSAPGPLPDTVRLSLKRIVERCLAKKPDQRYQRGGEIRAALDAISGRDRVGTDATESKTSLVIPAPAALTGTTSAVDLVGRETEIAAMTAAWNRSRAGQRQLVLITGEPGIGKTRLSLDFGRARQSEGATVLMGRCDQEALVPYQPFVEALDWYLRNCPTSLMQEQIAEAGGEAELASVLPEISRRGVSTPEPIESNPEGRRYRLFEAVSNLLCIASRLRPLMLLLDDIHWAARPTLLMLRHVLRSSQQATFCLVATYREMELDRTHPLADVLADIRRSDAVTRVSLGGLSVDHVDRLIHAWTGQGAIEGLTKLVFENTEGNPFFISEVLRHLGETGALDQLKSRQYKAPQDLGLPEGVKEAIGRRLTRLTETCNRVLALASVVGREFSFEVLHELSDLTEEKLLDVLDEALAAKIIQDAPGVAGRYTFTHALMRETLYGELTLARRVRLHQRVGEVLERLAKPGREPLADLAYHFGQAASTATVDKTVDYAIRAGEQAAASFALEEAARFYEIALNALDFLNDDEAILARRFDLRWRRGRAFADLTQWALARQDFEAALAVLDPADQTRRCELLVELAKVSFWVLDSPAAQRFADAAIVIADAIHRDDLWADAKAWIAGVVQSDGDMITAIEMDRQALERAGGARSMALARAPLTLNLAGRTQDAVATGRQAVEFAHSARDPANRVYSLSHLGLGLTAAGRYDEAMRHFAEARSFGKRHGILTLVARSIAMSTGVHMNLFDYDGAELIAREARDLAHQLAFPPSLVSASIDLLLIYARSHRPERAEALVETVTRQVTEASGWHGWLWRLRLAQALAELALARGDFARVIEETRHTIDQNPIRERTKYKIFGLATRAQARFALGEIPEAINDARRAVEFARGAGDPSVLLSALSVMLRIDGSDELSAEAQEARNRILGALSHATLRQRFSEARL